MKFKTYTPEEIIQNADQIVAVNIYKDKAHVYPLHGLMTVHKASIVFPRGKYIEGVNKLRVNFSEFGDLQYGQVFCLKKDVQEIVDKYVNERKKDLRFKIVGFKKDLQELEDMKITIRKQD